MRNEAYRHRPEPRGGDRWLIRGGWQSTPLYVVDRTWYDDVYHLSIVPWGGEKRVALVGRDDIFDNSALPELK